MPLFLLCLMIFACRIVDVSLATIRTVFTVKGKTLFATLVGFVEVLIWFLVVRQALNTSESGILVALSYAGGFAAGTYIGGIISRLIIVSKVQLQVITSNKNDKLIDEIRDNGFGLTILDVSSNKHTQEKYMIFIETNSKQIKKLKQIILTLDPKAFITVHESTQVFNGYFINKN